MKACQCSENTVIVHSSKYSGRELAPEYTESLKEVSTTQSRAWHWNPKITGE